MKKVSENEYFYGGIRKRIDELEAEGHYDAMEMATMIVNESIEADPVTPGKYTSVGNSTTEHGQLFYHGWTDLCIYEHAYLTFKEVYEYFDERNGFKETKK